MQILLWFYARRLIFTKNTKKGQIDENGREGDLYFLSLAGGMFT